MVEVHLLVQTSSEAAHEGSDIYHPEAPKMQSPQKQMYTPTVKSVNSQLDGSAFALIIHISTWTFFSQTINFQANF